MDETHHVELCALLARSINEFCAARPLLLLPWLSSVPPSAADARASNDGNSAGGEKRTRRQAFSRSLSAPPDAEGGTARRRAQWRPPPSAMLAAATGGGAGDAAARKRQNKQLQKQRKLRMSAASAIRKETQSTSLTHPALAGGQHARLSQAVAADAARVFAIVMRAPVQVVLTSSTDAFASSVGDKDDEYGGHDDDDDARSWKLCLFGAEGAFLQYALPVRDLAHEQLLALAVLAQAYTLSDGIGRGACKLPAACNAAFARALDRAALVHGLCQGALIAASPLRRAPCPWHRAVLEAAVMAAAAVPAMTSGERQQCRDVARWLRVSSPAVWPSEGDGALAGAVWTACRQRSLEYMTMHGMFYWHAN